MLRFEEAPLMPASGAVRPVVSTASHPVVVRRIKIIQLCATIGWLLSLYLLQDFLQPQEGHSFCDISDMISCSALKESSYALFFDIPLYVPLLVYNLSSLLSPTPLSLRGIKKNKKIMYNYVMLYKIKYVY
jgi:hypothetical protein